MIYQTRSEKETQQIAKDLAKEIVKKEGVKILALIGDLGAGKTTFAQGFAQGLKISERVISPSFVLIRQHKVPKNNQTFIHLDLYRLETKKALAELGLAEIFNDLSNIVLIEWAEKIESKLPKNTIKIKINKTSENERKIEIS